MKNITLAGFLLLGFVFLCLETTKSHCTIYAQENNKKGTKKVKEENVETLLLMGEKEYTAQNSEKALEIFKEVIKKFPEDARGYYYCGMILGERGKKEEAEKMYRTALEKDPKLSEANNNLAVILQEKKNFEEAEKLLLQALKSDPEYFEAQFNLGYLYEEWGKKDEAVKAYILASQINKSDTEALYSAAQIEEGQQNWGKAVSLYRQILDRAPAQEISIKILIAQCLRKQGKNQEALKELKTLIPKIKVVDGDDLGMHSNAFKVAREMRLAGDPKTALEIFNKFPDATKKTFSYKTEVAQCYMALGKCKNAVKIFEGLLKEKPQHPELLIALGDSYFCAGKCKKGVEAYNLFLKITEGKDKRTQEIKNKIASCKK